VGTDANKYFVKMVEETTLSPDAQIFFLKKKGKGGKNSSVITLNVHCQLSREFERQEQLPLELHAFRYR